MDGQCATPPPLGLGTWLRHTDDGYRAILAALEMGYRHIDTAQTYGTESHVGRAVKESRLSREDVFITTKVGDVNLARKDFLPSVERSLETLNVDAVDLVLIHWPSHKDAVPFESYMTDLAEAKRRGLTRRIGVSNYPCALIEKAVAVVGPGELVVNQVEAHPYLQNRQVRACSAAHGISVTAYMPLAGGRVAQDSVLTRIGGRLGEAATTVALAWAIQRGMSVIPASGRVDHMRANLRALDVTLTADDLAEVDALDRGGRIIHPTKSPEWD